MTVKDFLSVLIYDDKNNISIQTKDENGIMTEVANDCRLFNAAVDSHYGDEIKFIKFEKKKIFIIV